MARARPPSSAARSRASWLAGSPVMRASRLGRLIGGQGADGVRGGAGPVAGPGGDDDLPGAVGGHDAVQGAGLGVVEHDDPPVGGAFQPVPQRQGAGLGVLVARGAGQPVIQPGHRGQQHRTVLGGEPPRQVGFPGVVAAVGVLQGQGALADPAQPGQALGQHHPPGRVGGQDGQVGVPAGERLVAGPQRGPQVRQPGLARPARDLLQHRRAAQHRRQGGVVAEVVGAAGGQAPVITAGISGDDPGQVLAAEHRRPRQPGPRRAARAPGGVAGLDGQGQGPGGPLADRRGPPERVLGLPPRLPGRGRGGEAHRAPVQRVRPGQPPPPDPALSPQRRAGQHGHVPPGIGPRHARLLPAAARPGHLGGLARADRGTVRRCQDVRGRQDKAVSDQVPRPQPVSSRAVAQRHRRAHHPALLQPHRRPALPS